MRILHLSAECYPVAKVGGLADVVGSLPKYQNSATVVSQAVIPFYNIDFVQKNTFKTIFESELVLGSKTFDYKVVTLKKNHLGFDLFLVDIPDLLFKNYVYSEDDTERFLAFQIAVLDWVLSRNEKPDIVHCHDHHTGLTPFLMTQSFKYRKLKYIPTLLTIHNAQYQGWFSHDKSNLIPKFNLDNTGLLDWNGTINPLAAAIKCAWKVTTVSPSYMEELKKEANGLEHLLQHEHAKCIGILNGIDSEVWNPETDPYLIKNYKTSSVQSGSKQNKKWLCNKFGLNIEKPLFAFIGRLVREKGSDLFPEVFKKILQKHDVSILLLGSGNKEVESQLNDLKKEFIGSYNAYIGYDESLSHIIYAGADFLLMPSRVEPCGLNQMYALRYGTIPIVRSVGGLKDTVSDVYKKNGFGICHEKATVSDMVEAIERGIEFYKDQKTYRKIRKKIMGIDHSWNASAEAYIKLYKSLND